MGIRGLLILLFTSVVILMALVLGFVFFFLHQDIQGLLSDADIPFQSLFSASFIQYVVFASIGLFAALALGTWIFYMRAIHPIRELSEAVEAFIQRGEQLTFPNINRAPREIRTLSSNFTTFIGRAEQVHQKDTEMSRIKSDFISTAAHQFRTPLTGIRWALEALEKEQLTETQRELIVNAKNKSRDLVAIVKTLLDISSIESGKQKYMFEVIDLHALLVEVAHDFVPMANKAKVALYYAIDQTKFFVKGDRERLKWIFNNLIENAIRYTFESGAVRLSIVQNGSRILVNVQDTGIRIPAKDRANIFERFYRADNASAKENQGSGLGLYIARTIARDHGGDLSFADNEGTPGTTFTLWLPAISPP